MSIKHIFGGMAGVAAAVGGCLVVNTYQLTDTWILYAIVTAAGWALLSVAVVFFLASIDMIVNDKRGKDS